MADQKNRVYYFESTLSPDIFWIDLNALDFSADKSVRKLTLTNGEIYSGDAAVKMQDAEPLSFLFGI